MNALAEASVEAAAVEPAEADSDARSVVIRVAIIIRSRSIDRIAGTIVIRRRTARGVRTGLRRLIIARSYVAEGLRRAVGRDHDRIFNPEGENLFRSNVGGLSAGQQHADDSGSRAGAGADGRALSYFMPSCRS